MKLRHTVCVAFVVCLGFVPGLASPASAAPRKATAHTYVVRAGDGGWWRVAQAHGVTLSRLLAANHATAATPLRVGQTVTLPPQARGPGKTPKAAGKAPAATKGAAASHASAPVASARPAWPRH